MTHKGTVTLHTARLTLRRFELSDAAAMYKNWASDPEVTKYLTWGAHGSPDDTRQVLAMWADEYKSDSCYQWAIVPDDLGEPIGSIGVVRLNEEVSSAGIGYCIGRNFWHSGYTSEALAAVIKFLFEQVGANRVESWHDPENPNSGRVMTKCGMTFEGTLRSADRNNCGIVDIVMYSILADEYRAMADGKR